MVEELFAIWSDKHREYVPVFFEWDEWSENIGKLFFRDGDHHEEAVNKAEVLLGARGFEIGGGRTDIFSRNQDRYEYDVTEVT